MTKQRLKNGILVLVLLGFVLTSCTTDNAIQDGISLEEIDAKTAQTQAEVDHASEGVSTIVEEAYLSEENPAMTKMGTQRYLPSCVTVTAVLVHNMKTVTIDFGDGCELRNGNLVSGKIIFEYKNDREAATRMITYTFEDFYFNRKNIAGGGSILREHSNANENHQSTKTFDITVTWSDESVASKKGVKIREWIEGFGTPAWGDNVFLISGNGTFTKKNGTVLSTEIIEPLRRELACKFLVSGVVNLAKNNTTAILNYGDGSCDDLAILSINGGEEKEIHLRGKK